MTYTIIFHLFVALVFLIRIDNRTIERPSNARPLIVKWGAQLTAACALGVLSRMTVGVDAN